MQMTALAQYQRLEATGLWQTGPDAAPREVIVSFGQATLVLSDPGDEEPLAHWSLPAVVNLCPGQHPAIYAPRAPTEDEPPAETLTIAEPDMIDAITRIHQAIDLTLPHPGRLRRHLGLLLLILMIFAGIWWLPGLAIDHANRVALPAQQRSVGEAVLTDLTHVTGPACHRGAGDTALLRLADRLAPAAAIGHAHHESAPTSLKLHVLPGGIRGAVALPGGIILIGPDLLGIKPESTPDEAILAATQTEDEPDYSHLTSTRPAPRPASPRPAIATPVALPADPGPDILAGEILAAMQVAAETDPLATVLDHAGLWPSLTLLVRGAISPQAIQGYGLEVIGADPLRPQDRQALLARFAAVSVPSTPYAQGLEPRDSFALALMEGDPFREEARPRSILSKSEWEALREICETR